MQKKIPFIVAATFLAFGASSNSIGAADAVPASVTAAVHDAGRTPWDVQRDALRKPADVLAFSQIKPGMVVVDLQPGDGYYTRMLAKLVGPKGKVFAVVPPTGSGESTRAARMQQRDGKRPAVVPVDDAEACVLGCYPTGRPPYMLAVDQVLAIQNITEYSNVTVFWEELGSYGGDLAVPEQVDAVFTADAYHDLHAQKGDLLPEAVPGRPNIFKPLNMAAVNKSIFDTMKPGGVYLVLDHEAAKGAGFGAADSLHRTEADATKAEITGAGFVFDGESKVLAMASDDHTKPVGGVYAQRDGTDQYVLRFKKPANAANTDHRPKGKDEEAIMGNYYDNTEVFRVQMVKQPGVRNGERLRYNYYNRDHTYQEFGRVGEGPGPMQSGTWYWDAAGHNCQLHQFPIDERQSVVCHDDVLPHKVGVIEDRYLDKRPEKVQVEIVPGRVYFY